MNDDEKRKLTRGGGRKVTDFNIDHSLMGWLSERRKHRVHVTGKALETEVLSLRPSAHEVVGFVVR